MWGHCTRPTHPHFDRYGGRGILVCVRWRDFRDFLADMGERPAGTSLDRIDNDGNYEPGNCRWATEVEQKANTRVAIRLTLNGETLGQAEWARRLGVRTTTIAHRLRRGWPLERALTEPSRRPA